MALFEKSALKDGVGVREVWGWALFDAANSGYSTVVLTAVFNAYFVGTICGDADWATFLWTTVVAASNLICLIVMPGIGRAADRQGNKKRWLFWATAVCILATAALLFCREGAVILAALLVIVSNIGYSVGESLNSAFLPELAKKDALGRVSGWGWSLGYGGGLVTLALCLGLFAIGRTLGYTESDMVPTTGPVTAAVFAVTALPFFLWVKERSEPQSVVKPAAYGFFEAFAEAAAAVKVLPRFKDFGLLTLTGFLYQCGIATVIALAAVYAVAVMGFTVTQTLILVLLVNITAAVGAFFFGYAQDRLGHKLALALTLIVWIVMVVLAAAATSEWVFWIAANLAGLAMGSSQSAGRAMIGMLAPEKRRAEFFGLWNMALWLSAVVGPVTYGAVSWVTGNNQRLAILVLGLFFAAALLVLSRINLMRGAAAAHAADAGGEDD